MASMSNPAADSLRQHRAFVAFWFARIASGFGFQMLSVAVGWQIYAITGRALTIIPRPGGGRVSFQCSGANGNTKATVHAKKAWY